MAKGFPGPTFQRKPQASVSTAFLNCDSFDIFAIEHKLSGWATFLRSTTGVSFMSFVWATALSFGVLGAIAFSMKDFIGGNASFAFSYKNCCGLVIGSVIGWLFLAICPEACPEANSPGIQKQTERFHLRSRSRFRVLPPMKREPKLFLNSPSSVACSMAIHPKIPGKSLALSCTPVVGGSSMHLPKPANDSMAEQYVGEYPIFRPFILRLMTNVVRWSV